MRALRARRPHQASEGGVRASDGALQHIQIHRFVLWEACVVGQPEVDEHLTAAQREKRYA
jgi:hypothetical protein